MSQFGTKEIELAVIQLHDTFKHRAVKNMDLADLKDSISAHGLIHPPTVRPLKDGYELIAGFRRFSAIQAMGWKTAAFNVRELTDVEAMSISLTENAGRKDLTPIDEARAFKSAIEVVGMKAVEVAKVINKSESYVSNRIRLLTLVPEAQEAIDQGKMTPGHAEHALFKIPEKYPRLQKKLVKDILKDNLTAERAECNAKYIMKEQKESEDFQAAKKAAKFPLCPKCKGKAAKRVTWRGPNVFECEKNGMHEWDSKTGKMTGYHSDVAARTGISAAQEARKRMEAPRTAYFDTTMEAVNKKAHKMVLEALKCADLANDDISVHIHNYKEGIRSFGIKYGGSRAEFTVPGCQEFHVDKKEVEGKVFVTTKIAGYSDPKKKDYEKMSEILDGVPQVKFNGKPIFPGEKPQAHGPGTPANPKYRIDVEAPTKNGMFCHLGMGKPGMAVGCGYSGTSADTREEALNKIGDWIKTQSDPKPSANNTHFESFTADIKLVDIFPEKVLTSKREDGISPPDEMWERKIRRENMITEKLEKVRTGTCERCGYAGFPASRAKCPACGSRRWDVPLRNRGLSDAMKKRWAVKKTEEGAKANV